MPPLDRAPFTRTKLDEEREEEGETITVRLNEEERRLLEEIKEDLNIASDSKALKMSAFIGSNVLQGTFSRPVLRYLFKKERKRLEDIKSF